MHRLCQRACRLLTSRPAIRYHICLPCASQLLQRSFTVSTPLRDSDDEVTVRYYEQTAPGKIRRINEDEQEKEAEVLKARIVRLEKELREIESSDELSKGLGDHAPGFMKKITAMRKELDDEKDLEELGISPEERNAPEGLDVEFPQHQQVVLQSFNKALREVAKDVKDAKRNAILWKQYVRCKQLLPDFLEEITSPAWEVLWRSQYVGNPSVSSRTTHLWELTEDMIRARHDLSSTQKLVRIEQLFSQGNKQDAMSLLELEWKRLGKDNSARADFRDLGIRLNAELGRLEEAQHLALDSVKSDSTPKAGDIATLIASWAQKGDEDNLKIAWSLYLYLRQHLGTSISLDDYDHIVMSFLGAGRPSLALAAFKDMVLSGERHEWDSLERAKTTIGLYRELQNHTTQLADLTQVSLASLSFIPRKLENKFFFASWIKRLIGMGEVDAAVPVLELMFQRGIRPDAIHLNGMISAWLRGEDKQKHDLALQVAWSMVKERLKLVARRNATQLREEGSVELPDMGVLVPPYISKNLPPATIETFSILLLYYENRSMHTSMDIVQQMLLQAEISPNSFFMNHLLHAELRRGDVAEAWKKFGSMNGYIKPDLATFAVLWDCSKVFTTSRNISAKAGFPSPRTIFSTMMHWLPSLRPNKRKSAKEDFSQDLYNLIIRCFCERRDIEGTILALYALRDTFSAYPDADTVRLVSMQLARTGENRTSSVRRRARLSANKESMKNMAKVAEIFKLVGQERSSALQDIGVDEDKLLQEQKNEELLWKLAEVLRIFMRHLAGVRLSEGEWHEEGLEKVAFQMGLGGMNMEEPRYPEEGSAPLVAEAA